MYSKDNHFHRKNILWDGIGQDRMEEVMKQTLQGGMLGGSFSLVRTSVAGKIDITMASKFKPWENASSLRLTLRCHSSTWRAWAMTRPQRWLNAEPVPPAPAHQSIMTTSLHRRSEENRRFDKSTTCTLRHWTSHPSMWGLRWKPSMTPSRKLVSTRCTVWIPVPYSLNAGSFGCFFSRVTCLCFFQNHEIQLITN